MLAWIFADDAYTEQYHAYFSDFLDQFFTDGWVEEEIDRVTGMIAPYVEKDPTKFCTYEEFQTGTAALKTFCQLRAESILGQLSGTIPADSQGQEANRDARIDASGLNLSDMGSMGFGMGGGRHDEGQRPEKPGESPAGSPSRELTRGREFVKI